ncbi:hypothetical protein GTW15_17815 [Vibrio cholerae]|nr:hypothetical protein [Vibrio cholerae]EIN5961512.1 hypothetical protein [Vibrio cholerae]EJU9689482.1 hypothetical protein [Vibrio cholerae]
MLALLILPILISGFIALSSNPYNKLRLHRYDGQLLYLKAAKKGFIYFLITLCTCLLLKEPRYINLLVVTFHTPDVPLVTLLANTMSSSLDSPKSDLLEAAWLVTLSILTVLFTLLAQKMKKCSVRVQNIIANRSTKIKNDVMRIHMLGEILKDSPIDYMFYESFRHRKPIMITLKSRKVYVGIINKLGEPNESREPNQEVSLVTAMSGYRDKDTLEIKFTNNYSPDTENSEPDEVESVQPIVAATDDGVAQAQKPETLHIVIEEELVTKTPSEPTEPFEAIQILRLEHIETVCWFHHDTFSAVNGNLKAANTSLPQAAA